MVNHQRMPQPLSLRAQRSNLHQWGHRGRHVAPLLAMTEVAALAMTGVAARAMTGRRNGSGACPPAAVV
jgi:hypothetical protein